MQILAILGCVAIAIVYMQIYYILLHYQDITTYVNTYSNYRYGIDIVPNYIDPSTSDYNDTIFPDVNSKRRCALDNGNYVIVSDNGYAVDTNNNILTYTTLISCVIDMTENYSTYALYDPCLINSASTACSDMLALL